MRPPGCTAAAHTRKTSNHPCQGLDSTETISFLSTVSALRARGQVDVVRNKEAAWSWKSSQAHPSHPRRWHAPTLQISFFIFFPSELSNGRSVPQLPGSFSLLPYLLGNTIYLDVHRKAQPPHLWCKRIVWATCLRGVLGMSEGQNALLGRMKWPGRTELTTDLKLYDNVVFLGKV